MFQDYADEIECIYRGEMLHYTSSEFSELSEEPDSMDSSLELELEEE
jgi:hypothetical protein